MEQERVKLEEVVKLEIKARMQTSEATRDSVAESFGGVASTVAALARRVNDIVDVTDGLATSLDHVSVVQVVILRIGGVVAVLAWRMIDIVALIMGLPSLWSVCSLPGTWWLRLHRELQMFHRWGSLLKCLC